MHTRLHYPCLLLLVLAAPFERLEPVFVLPWQKFSNLELVILVSLLAWFAFLVSGGGRPAILRHRLAVPVVALLVWMALSSLLAPAHRTNSLQFTGRFLVGVLLFSMVLDTLTHRRRLVGLMTASTAAASLVAILGILESFEVARVLELLDAYRPGIGFVKAQVRVSSTLQYPTIASMYLELAFGLGLGLMLSRTGVWHRRLLFLCLALIGAATIATLTRTGLLLVLTLPLVSAGMWALHRGRDARFFLLLATSATVLVLLGAALLRDPLLWLRITGEDSSHGYQVEYGVPSRLELAAGSDNLIQVRVRNSGPTPWPSDGENAFALSYHWLNREGTETLIFEGARTVLEQTVSPGESLPIQARVVAPTHPGTYILAWDMVQENRLWFSAAGSGSPHSLVTIPDSVQSSGPGTEPPPASLGQAPVSRLDTARTALWRAAVGMVLQRPLLGVGPDNFRLLYGEYLDLQGWRRNLHANNMYLEVLATMGLVGAGLFLWLVWRILSTLAIQWKTISEADLPLFLGIAAACAAFLIHGLTDHFLSFTPTYVMIWIVLGMVASLPASLRSGAERESPPPSSGRPG